uniref:OCIA domain-containing protein 1 n=1 Tax=Lepeophtheirus salmonis TaxID=72036 RepID=D3PGD0_LEPSM|nr:OCIA domain-containing protein 1 [Lepeophtheirus salmonis]
MDIPRQPLQQQQSLHPNDAPPTTQLSDEEQTVLRACQKESTMYRAFPLSALAGVTTYFSINNFGLMKPHHTYGASPKVVLAVALGYIVGKISYYGTCQDKILSDTPNSNLAAAVRRVRRMPPIPKLDEQGQESLYTTSEDTSPSSAPTDQQEKDQELPLSIRTYQDRQIMNRKMHEAHQYMASPQQPVRQPHPVYQPPPPPITSGGSKPTNKYGDEGFE